MQHMRGAETPEHNGGGDEMSPKKEFVLAVDIDGTLGDYEDAFRHVVAARYGIDPETIPPQDDWEFTEATGWPITSREEFVDLHRSAVVDHGIFRRMQVYPGAAEVLRRLSDLGVWIRIVSHRLCFNHAHAVVASDTVNWLDDRRLPYRDLCLIGDKAAVGADCYIDDSPSQVTALREQGVDVVVFDHPYNRHLSGPRAADWGEVERYVLKRLFPARTSAAA